MEPKVSLSPQLEEGEDRENVLKLGHTLAEDTVTRTLELKNDTALTVRFEIEMESLLPKHKRKKRPNTFSKLACQISIVCYQGMHRIIFFCWHLHVDCSLAHQASAGFPFFFFF